ncbi:hypothetical protein AA098_10125 [Pseudomonas sp. JY-Q]|uniref:hypothetical protein n=1 Tax=Pseudomonas sp. JY-Q TaxID=1338689 RepID=UPI0007DD2181|nr:hypothetical protein [Pseudomonas sp. JY-Q]ANI33817.1 hypothetical protein AA098_10125 [Pseudomonas sp. JY-Q]
MSKALKLVYGVGANDADYQVCLTETVGGRRRSVWTCPFYKAWTGMLERCYSEKFQIRNPTYHDCSAASDWLTFSSFRAWMSTQDHEGKHLDKDLLVPGNKVYSPDTCAFIPPDLNRFMVDSQAIRGDLPIGVSWHKARHRFVAQCRNPFTGRHEFLGYHTSASEAHQAWREHKHRIAIAYAETQSDSRIAAALRTRYAA